MDMKNKKKGNKNGRGLLSVLRDNKGIEARVLVYVLAAVVLVASIGIAISAIQGAGGMANEAMDLANVSMQELSKSMPGG